MSGLSQPSSTAGKSLKVKNIRVNYANRQHQKADVLPNGRLACELRNEHGDVYTAGESTVPELISLLKENSQAGPGRMDTIR